MNPFNNRYQDAFADALGVRSAFSFWKGRVALYALLRALGIGPRDEVILPGFTCVVVPNAVLYCDAVPIYADIDSNTFNLDPGCFERAITPRARAVVIQHTFGVPADMDALLSIARDHRIAIIEDCAHALGSEYRGQPVGTFGDAAFFSFQWSKPYTTGLGGMAVTNNAELGLKIGQVQASFEAPRQSETRKLALQYFFHQHFLTPKVYWPAMSVLHSLSKLGLFIGSSDQNELSCNLPGGYERGMSDFQARQGLKQIKSAWANITHRRTIAGRYQRRLSERAWRIQALPTAVSPAYLRYPLLVKNKQAVLASAKRNRVEIGSWFESVLHPAGTPLEKANYRLGQCPVAESVAEHIINLPTHPRVDEQEAERIIGFLSRSAEPCY